jgi:hypothetical protein
MLDITSAPDFKCDPHPSQASRRVARDSVTLLCDRQDKIEIGFNDDGDAIITQSSWPDEDSIIIVARDNIPHFIDRLTDALGIPSIGGPSR